MIFSGNGSKALWELINNISKQRRKKDIAKAACEAIYALGCKCQELENQVKQLKFKDNVKTVKAAAK